MSEIALTVLIGKTALAKKKSFAWTNVFRTEDLDEHINGRKSKIKAYMLNTT